MDTTLIMEEAKGVLKKLKANDELARFLDSCLHIPAPYSGSGPIKLVVLGQDPTIKDAEARRSIATVLNLGKKTSVWNYLVKICLNLGIEMAKNVYATNLYKNFFVAPPTQIKEIDIFIACLQYWLPLFEEELAQFPDVPVITLGQPVMRVLLKPDVSDRLREYWGHTPRWRAGELGPFQYIRPEDNILGRAIFPFPHLQTGHTGFYKSRMDDYIAYVKAAAFTA